MSGDGGVHGGSPSGIRLLLCGDVMPGRGIDQVLRHPGDPRLFEPYATSALDYVALAERRSGPLPRRADDTWVWGQALAELEHMDPDVRVANLETAVTTHDRPWAGKAVHYRMNPANVTCLKPPGFGCLALANNHSLDWGRAGLKETLEVLGASEIASAGAGCTLDEARAPVALAHRWGGRVLVFSRGAPNCGIPSEWAATAEDPGIGLLDDVSPATARSLGATIRSCSAAEDLVVVSIHWGPNWGFEIPDSHRTFAHLLIDEADVDVVHGHSSHHAMGIEVYRGRPIFYGCGDLLNDYEGIQGHEGFRDDLAPMYFPTFDPEGRELVDLRITPLVLRRFRLEAAGEADRAWLRAMLDREGRALGTRAELDADGRIVLRWRGTGGR